MSCASASLALGRWVDGIAAGTIEGPTAWDGCTSLVVADACIRSIATGRPEDVPLEEKPAFYQAM